MAHPTHNIFGRSVGVTPLLTGLELIKYNSSIASRKVILKKVPSMIGLPELKLALEKSYGTVEMIFAFKNERESKLAFSKADRKFKVYSVLFAQKSSARCITEKGKFILPTGDTVAVEKFRRSRIGDPNHTSSKQSSSDVLVEQVFFTSNPKKTESSEVKAVTILLQNAKHVSNQSPSARTIIDKNNLFSSEKTRNQKLFLELRPFSKPTSRVYFMVSRCVNSRFNNAPHLATSDSPREVANIRFNFEDVSKSVRSVDSVNSVMQKYTVLKAPITME